MNKLVFVLAFFMIIVGLPVILGVGGDMFKRWLKHKEKMAEALNAQTAEKAAQYAAHTERLEQRVRVLERIVTDKGLEISDEIERLRDLPAPASVQRPLN
jgi:LytS/YehU family sensor histidine kinase